jgi:hypothetical protein
MILYRLIRWSIGKKAELSLTQLKLFQTNQFIGLKKSGPHHGKHSLSSDEYLGSGSFWRIFVNPFS